VGEVDLKVEGEHVSFASLEWQQVRGKSPEVFGSYDDVVEERDETHGLNGFFLFSTPSHVRDRPPTFHTSASGVETHRSI